jgi:osmotically-inducible protein OsmY
MKEDGFMQPVARKNSSQIAADLVRELAWDTLTKGSAVSVSVDGGTVTLSGDVESYAAKMAAEEAARRVAGTTAVVNDLLVVMPDHRACTDAELASAVRHALTWDLLVPDGVRSRVEGGVVVLEGEVSALQEREEAERAVRRLRGVRGVRNELAIWPSDLESSVVHAMIEEALERRGAGNPERVAVAVENGLATLSGRVRSYAERQELVGAIAHAPGIRAVDDRLIVDPHQR